MQDTEMNKIFLFLMLVIIGSFACLNSVAQNVQVCLKIETYSPFIKRYNKEEMQKKLIDTVITTYHSRFRELGIDLHFYDKTDSQFISKLPTYKLQLLVTDSVGDTKKAKGLHSVIVRGKLFEGDIPSDLVEWQHGSGITYSSLPGEMEDDAINSIILFTKIAAGQSLEMALPLSLSERKTARNFFEKEDLEKLESLKEVVVIVDYQNIATSQKSDMEKLTTLIHNIFYFSQNRYAKRKGDKAYLNYYICSAPDSYPSKTVYDNQIQLRLVIESVGLDCYELRMQFDEKKYLFRDYFGKDLENNTIRVTREMLERMPSRINYAISELVDIFVRSNFD
jgi:hypothetical protein